METGAKQKLCRKTKSTFVTAARPESFTGMHALKHTCLQRLFGVSGINYNTYEYAPNMAALYLNDANWFELTNVTRHDSLCKTRLSSRKVDGQCEKWTSFQLDELLMMMMLPMILFKKEL
ncbi:hypothetical protein DPMN_128071 [Dreissena polymorpha]|uniref:Uncharacterized protein n=1 Tax=Dreissena polymorpha TaxID=45954 RepID=A0A9D4JVE6_DREPO|nr:hypothetical protein DPMN_128071 [Dreissena polymorpha]